MVQLSTNVSRFWNDIAEEIRLFLGLEDIEESCKAPDLALNVQLKDKQASCSALPSGIVSKVTVEPYKGALEQKRQEKRAVKLAVYQVLKQLYPSPTPWGSLTGIRPTKLYRETVNRVGEAATDKQFRETFTVSPEKLALAKKICAVQKPIIESACDDQLDVYLGIPYCRSRCLYCSFGSEVAKKPDSLADYVFYLKKDIEEGARLLKDRGWRLRCSYFGGGTPTVLPAELLREVLACAQNAYGSFGEEFTVEAGRPDTIDSEKLRVLRDFGVTRISINPQTMNDKTLGVIGRFHTANEIVEAFALARKEGFSNINMDVIAGLPGETEADFACTLSKIKALAPESLTVHTLAIKRSSNLKKRLEEFPLPGSEAVEAMVAMGAETAEEMGMEPYYMYRQKYMQGNLENVGYSKTGFACVYNVDMMEETLSILAHGAGSMTKRVYPGENRVERIPNPKDAEAYFLKQPRLFEEKKRLFCRLTDGE